MRLVTAVLSILMLVPRTAVAGPALLFDAADGKVLYSEDIDNLWYPASLTKLMTAYLTFEAIKDGRLKLDQRITSSAHARKQPPSKIGLPAEASISVETALQALIIKSANDVAVMLAEAIDGSEAAFVARMNATARKLGMGRTMFVNPNGLPAAGQVTTARDLARLTRAILKSHSGYSAYWAMPSMQLGKLKLRSHNSLLKTLEGADGMKTGFICDSGFNVVASATREGTKLIAVVLGEESADARTIRAASLLEHGFQQLGWKTLFNNDTIDNLPIAADAKGVISVRKQVTAWSCNPPKKKAKSKSKSATKPTKKAKSADAKPAKPAAPQKEAAPKAAAAAKPAP